MKRIAFLFIISGLLYSQKGKHTQAFVDDVSISTELSNFSNSSFPSSLAKLKDPNITGGKISNYSKYWLYSNNVSATSMPLSAGAVDLAEDQNGNLFISIPAANIIKKIDSNGIITIYAGVAGINGHNGDDKLATEASLNSPHGLAIDPNGNLFFADRDNHVVRKIDSNGIITNFAGTPSNGGFAGDGGLAVNAQLQDPYDVILDPSGNLFISEKNRIRKVDTNGNITTFAGDGGDDFSGDGAAAVNAGLYRPAHMAMDQFGNLYFADFEHHVVRKIDTNGTITSVYGVGGASGDSSNDPKRLNTPFGVSYERVKIDARGEDEDHLYIADYKNSVIIQVVLRGKQAGEPSSGESYVEADFLWGEEGTPGFAGDGDANWDETARFNQVEIMTTNFTSTATSVKAVYYVLDYGNKRVRRITEEENLTNNTDASNMTTIAGADVYNTNIAVKDARFFYPRNSQFDASGNLYVADQYLHIIRKIDTNGLVTTVAGTVGEGGQSGDGGPATSAKINSPRGVTVDSKGNLYISDSGNNLIRKVDTNGNISTFAGSIGATNPGDGGPATSAAIGFPYQLAVDAADNLYIADNGNHSVRKVDVSTGIISTYAGNRQTAYGGDGGQATNAAVHGPLGIAFDNSGNLYIAQTNSHVIRKVDTNGIISTLAGSGEAGYSEGQGNSAQFNNPSTLAVDSKGNVYVTDTSNRRIRKITSSGLVSTVAGNGTRGIPTADSVAFKNQIGSAYGISIDKNDNIYFSDTGNRVLRKVTPRKTTLKVPSEYATIQSAIDFALANDTILIDSGTYYESLTINSNHGTIVVKGVNAKTTIIDGGKTGRTLFINNSPNNVIKNLTFQNGASTSNDPHGGGGVQIDNSENTTLMNLIFKNNYSNNHGSAIGIVQEVTKKPTNIINVLAYNNNGPNTFYSYGGKTNIVNSTFFNNQPKNIPSSARIDITYTDRCCDQGESRVRVLNSIIGGGIRKLLPGESKKASHFTAINSYLARRDTLLLESQDVISPSNEHFEMIPGGAGEWVLTPVFVDSANGDYRLADYSPGIGYGELSRPFPHNDNLILNAPSEDLNGNARSSSVKPDIGAYENQFDTPQNAPPVLSAIQDVSVNEDESVSVQVNAINAFNLDNDPIVFSASSEKDEVKINVGSSSGKLDISASANWNGSSKISVSATDGKAFDYGNFTVNFLPVNDKPELEPISDFSIDEEAVTAITVTASDVDGDQLTVSATTSTNEVVPSVDGMELTLTPAKDFVGTAKVNVFVTDGSLTDTVSYQLTVLNVNDAPVLFEIKDQIVSEDSGMNVRVVASDVDDNVLAYDGKSDNVGVGVSAAADTIKLQPATDFFGSSVITVYASDGKDVDSTTFILKVNPMQDSPFPFEWVSSESDTVIVTKDNVNDTYNLEWSESKDVDDEGIDYLLYAKIGAYEKELVYDTTVTKLAISYQEIVENVFDGAPNHGATVVLSLSATDRIDTVDVSGSDRVIYVNQYQYLSIENEGIPDAFVLHDNYPNPFNPTTQIRFDLPKNDNVNLTIYNMLGQKVKVFSINNISAGYHQITWDATNDIGDPVSAGVYLYQLQTSEFVKTKKMILLK